MLRPLVAPAGGSGVEDTYKKGLVESSKFDSTTFLNTADAILE